MGAHKLVCRHSSPAWRRAGESRLSLIFYALGHPKRRNAFLRRIKVHSSVTRARKQTA
jgi:hypothetical protein